MTFSYTYVHVCVYMWWILNIFLWTFLSGPSPFPIWSSSLYLTPFYFHIYFCHWPSECHQAYLQKQVLEAGYRNIWNFSDSDKDTSGISIADLGWQIQSESRCPQILHKTDAGPAPHLNSTRHAQHVHGLGFQTQQYTVHGSICLSSQHSRNGARLISESKASLVFYVISSRTARET